MIDVELSTPGATRELAARVAPHVAAGDLIVLTGPLGSGKTFFTRALCRSLGLPASVRVPSPTFTLVHEHATKPPLSHADLYRSLRRAVRSKHRHPEGEPAAVDGDSVLRTFPETADEPTGAN